MRKLLCKDVPFVWTETLSKEFQTLKAVICTKVTLSSYDPKLETRLLVDSSLKTRIVYVLIQVDGEGNISN